jgi:hypothetical protein
MPWNRVDPIHGDSVNIPFQKWKGKLGTIGIFFLEIGCSY